MSYGAYLPYWRLQRGAIGRTLGSGGGKGTRSVASFDEDSTSMGVESGRIALAGAALSSEVNEPSGLAKRNSRSVRRDSTSTGCPVR